jgi:hypothetical protein
MNPHKTVLFAVAGVALFALTGCSSRRVVVAEPAGAVRPTVVGTEPPEVEQRGVAPHADSVWVPGHWEHKRELKWVNGHWIAPMFERPTYIPGRWIGESDQWAYFPGHWQ